MKRKYPRVELRHDEDGQLDEFIVLKPDMVHFEVMSDQSIWCGVTVGKDRYRVWIASKNGRSHIGYTVEKD